jgi:hypothetical protein
MNEPTAPPPPPAGSPPPTGHVTQEVQGPAIGLIITAVIGIVLALVSLLSNLMGAGMAGIEEIGGMDEAGRYLTYMTGGVGILFALIQLGVSGFVIWAALQMKELRNWTMAVTASILAMIPCIGPCCLIGIPIGIWSLVVLMKPEVKAAFTG